MSWLAIATVVFGLFAVFVVAATIGLLWAHRH